MINFLFYHLDHMIYSMPYFWISWITLAFVSSQFFGYEANIIKALSQMWAVICVLVCGYISKTPCFSNCGIFVPWDQRVKGTVKLISMQLHWSTGSVLSWTPLKKYTGRSSRDTTRWFNNATMIHLAIASLVNRSGEYTFTRVNSKWLHLGDFNVSCLSLFFSVMLK